MAKWKIGELAKRTGLTVRALHHYDHVGLLAPSERSEAGCRLYGPEDVRRLTTIVLLRGLGLSLDKIRVCLEQRSPELSVLLDRHVAVLEQQLLEPSHDARAEVGDLGAQPAEPAGDLAS
ncbi:MAG: MerR family transcriptional regulator [Thermoanaerobaculia bacterium]|nr:MerR family transcriptional regulator [Thermoanaerobaculia bacterium]